MKRACLLGAFALALSASASASTAACRDPAPLRAMTYNIRYDNPDDGPNGWAERRDAVVGQIRLLRPDFLALQEVMPNQRADLIAALNDYVIVGTGREDVHGGGEAAPIAIRADGWRIVSHGQFWLSPTPDAPSRGWDAAEPRVATWARVVSRAGGGRLLVVGTHFDHRGVEARAESARQIRDWMRGEARPGEAQILLGDFNTEATRLADLSPTLRDARKVTATTPAGPPGTFNGFDYGRRPAAAIDHIFVSPELSVTSYAVVEQTTAGRLISDHYPVVADVLARTMCRATRHEPGAPTF